MTNFFDSIYLLVYNKRGRIYSGARYFIRKLANIVLPCYYRLTKGNLKYSLCACQDPELIVSITSFPARINDIWKVIESLLRQTAKPDAIILWLSKEQFSSINTLPKSLLQLQSRGLQIKLRDGDIRSHKKYYYIMKEFPKSDFIIVDDDVIYNSRVIEELVKLHKNHPDMICCNLGDRILDKDSAILPYKYWNKDIPKPYDTGRFILPIGVGGVYYPVSSLHPMVTNEDVFMKICPKADDLWLWSMAYINNTQFVCSEMKTSYLPVEIKNNIRLAETNTISSNSVISGNDSQMHNIVEYLESKNIAKINFSENYA